MNAKSLVVAMMGAGLSMIGLGLSTMGCIQNATNEELAALDLVGYEPQDNPTGSDTSNEYPAGLITRTNTSCSPPWATA